MKILRKVTNGVVFISIFFILGWLKVGVHSGSTTAPSPLSSRHFATPKFYPSNLIPPAGGSNNGANYTTTSDPIAYQNPASYQEGITSTFQARGDIGGGGYGAGGGHAVIGGGGWGGGGVGTSPVVYKYQVYPNGGGGGGWGPVAYVEEDDDDFDFDKGLLGLLGLKGLKGLKGLLGLLKGLFLLAKLGLLPFLLPLLLPLLLLLLPLLLLPLLLLLLIPVPVITTPVGRKLLESTEAGQNLKKFLKDKLDGLISNLPEDIGHIMEKIKGKGADLELSEIWNTVADKASSSKGTARHNTGKWGNQNKLGDSGSTRAKVGYVAAANAANIKPSPKPDIMATLVGAMPQDGTHNVDKIHAKSVSLSLSTKPNNITADNEALPGHISETPPSSQNNGIKPYHKKKLIKIYTNLPLYLKSREDRKQLQENLIQMKLHQN